MSNEKEQQTPKPQIISPLSIPSGEAFGTPTVWQTYSFAPDWFNDALNEARTGRDHHARRREILLAVCAAESYVLEWVRDEVLNRDFNELNTYFPANERRGVKEKWRDIPRELHENGRITARPDWGGIEWQDLRELVSYRDGLVHARASRPETSSLPTEERPLPSLGDLSTIPVGWAVQVVIRLIRHLHAAIGTPTPAWLVEP